LRRLLADTPACVLVDRTWLSGDAGPEWNSLRERLWAMPLPVFPLEGRDILALGLPPGPRVGALLRSVRSWWLRGGCVADAEACREQVRRQIPQ
jgi:poly(A) polymerase